jgi:nitroreductase
MSILDVIKQRRSIRRYLPNPVEDEKLAKILEAGRYAPTASNRQLNKVIVVKDAELRRKLVPVCKNQSFVADAPVLLVVYSDHEGRIMSCGQSAGAVDLSIMLSFMMLQATELGLGTCWLGAFYSDQMKELLDIPDNYTVVASCTLGYSADSGPREIKRTDIAEFVKYDHY